MVTRLLGEVEFLYRRDLAVVRILDKKAAMAIGYRVYGPDLSLVGRVVDVLGPFNQPRALVKLLRPQQLRESSRLYYDPRELRRVV